MSSPSLQPRLLDDFQAASPRATRIFLGLFLLLWLSLLSADWIGRFALFHWHRTVISPPPAISSANADVQSAYHSVESPPVRGSTFSKAIPLPWLRAPYEELHPSRTVWTDPDGYDNPPLPPGEHWQGVVVGDSFMLAGSTQTFAQALTTLTGHPILNRARAAAGPFLELKRYLAAPPLDPSPSIIIWNLTSRELHGDLFSRQPIDSWFDARPAPTSPSSPRTPPSRFHPETLHPTTLARTWPNTSLPAYLARHAAAAFSLVVFRSWPHVALGVPDTPFGPVLFYRENLRFFPHCTPEQVPAVSRTVLRVAERLRERGVTLVVLLVPEKDQIYLDLLPPSYRPPILPSLDMLNTLENTLRQNGVHTVNLLHPFLSASSTAPFLYWRDDPHWSPPAFSLAAQATAAEIRPLIP